MRGRSSLLIFQDARGVLSELAPACSTTTGRPRERGLPGFVGPVPPPLWIRAREYSVVAAAFWLAARQCGASIPSLSREAQTRPDLSALSERAFWYSLLSTPPGPALERLAPILSLPAPPACLGVDLAGLPSNPTGVAVVERGTLTLLRSIDTDDAIVALAHALGPRTVVAINAPLTLPRGRCCLDDDCRCRHDPGTRSRQVERTLARERVPTLATALIKVLARRGIGLAAHLRRLGFTVVESYPYATLRILGLPAGGKRSRAGRRLIADALAPLVPGLNGLDPTEHELDAVVCALTADLWLHGRCRLVGDPAEGQMVVPMVTPEQLVTRRPFEPPAAYAVAAPAAKRAAEATAPYEIGSRP